MFVTGLKPSYFNDAFSNVVNQCESGYESLLYSSSVASTNTSFLSSIDSNSSNSLFSQPSTPVKTSASSSTSSTSLSTSSSSSSFRSHNSNQLIFNRNNSSTTPDLKQQYVADINGFYFASLKSPAKSSTTTTTTTTTVQSPIKSSPAKFNPDDFIRERDSLKSKLLRSPAFMTSPCYSIFTDEQRQEEKPVVKSFTSRLSAYLPPVPKTEFATPFPPPAPSASSQSVRTTPTEEEFMQLLFKNRHMPNNPEFLIGSRMGLEHIDVLSELNKRSMHMVIDQVFSYLNKVDYVKIGCVSKEWREIIRQDTKRNRERSKFLKQKRSIYEMNKENPFGCTNALDRRLMTSASEKRAAFKASKLSATNTIVVNEEESTMLRSNQIVFGSLDVNALRNCSNIDKMNRHYLRNSLLADSNGDLLNHTLDQQQAPIAVQVSAGVKKTAVNKDSVTIKFKLEDDFQDFSLNDVEMMIHQEEEEKQQQQSLVVVKTKTPIKATSLVTPAFIAKNLQAKSPFKSSPRKPGSLSQQQHQLSVSEKIDIIGSKKSKKNLKRL